jgi:putative ABC transport system permease protein
MNPFRTIRLKLRALGQRRAVKQEIDEELRFHLEQRTAENITAGMSPDEAAREARKRFGNFQSVREECRQKRGASFGEATLQDVRFGLRRLRTNPGFTIMAVFILAIGIGSTAAIFDVVRGVLLTSPPYTDPDRIVLVTPERLDGRPHTGALDGKQWCDWRTEAKSFKGMAGYGWEFCFLIRPDGSEPVEGQKVTRDYFQVMGVKPLLGRTFVDSDGDAVASGSMPTVIILGYHVWHRIFNGDPEIVGKAIQIRRYGGTPPVATMTVVGVMPPGIRFLPSPHNSGDPNYDVNADVDFWFPLPTAPEWSFWNVVARLNDATTIPRAQAEMTAIAARQAQANPEFQGKIARVRPLQAEMNRQGWRLLLPLAGAVTLVFLISCANVTGLSLVRAHLRQKDYVVRAALGAGRTRLLRQALTESLLLAFLGGGLGILSAMAIVKVLKVAGGFAIPRLDTVTLGWPIVIACCGLGILAAVVAGILPAARASLVNPAQVHGAGRTSSIGCVEHRVLKLVVIVQTALTLALLVGAGLLVRSVDKLARLHPGYDTGNILTLSVTSMQTSWEDFDPLSRIAALPGVKHAAFAWGLPLSGNAWTVTLDVDGGADLGPIKDGVVVQARSVTSEYFDALGFRFVSGRGFRPTDNSDNWKSAEANPGDTSFVAVINKTMADQHFPNSNPIGKRVRSSLWPKRAAEIVGVVANARTDALTLEPGPEIYFSGSQMYVFSKHLIIQTESDPYPLIGTVQRELRAIDPSLAIARVKTLEQLRSESVAPQTFAMRLLLAFSFVGSVLAMVGIYGVLSLSVGSRKREIAIRIAMGAPRRNVLGMVLVQGLKMIGAGLLIGTVAAIVLARMLRSFLFEIEPTDPVTFLVAVCLFGVVGLLACYVPARRAMNTDPMTALRYE